MSEPSLNKTTIRVNVDRARDALLTDFGKETLEDRYLLPGESYQDLFARVASYFADDDAHAQRLYNYISKHWFMPATPVLTNGGTTRGLPISCYLNESQDNLEGIVDIWNENVWLAAKGGGIGTYWGNLRSIGEKIRTNGKTSGIIPFVRVMDSLTLAISQGSLRRGNAAIYLPVEHPEIEEFIELRKPTGGDHNRKTPNLHHGIVLSDKFMKAVEEDLDWELLSPHTKEVIRTVSARQLWIRILTARIETGEPYVLYIDHVNNARPEIQKRLGLKVKTSNLCSEITLPTGLDHHGKPRTAVCCLSSLNLDTYDEWKDNDEIVEDIMRFLDNVLEDYIQNAPDFMKNAAYAASRERSVGLGVMGFHSYLQKMNIPFESVMAKVWNKKIFENIRKKVDAASKTLADEKGPCPDAKDAGLHERFSNKMAIAPTASISTLCGGTSPGIEPIAGNAYLQKTMSGNYTVRNKYLKKALQKYGKDTDETWSSITTNEGSVQHLDFLTQDEKDVFKTAFELDQRWIIELAGDRAPYICQAQSINLFVPANIHKRDLHMIHMQAWKKGVKSLYYCRSKSIQRPEVVATQDKSKSKQIPLFQDNRGHSLPNERSHSPAPQYEECLSCQ